MQLVGVQQRLGQHLRRLEVDVDHRVPEGIAHLRQGLVAGDACVVHDDIQAFGQRLDQALRRVFGADIQGHRLPTQARCQSLQCVGSLGYVEQHHVGAITGEHFGDGGADAARGAGDQRLLAGQRARPVPDLFGAGAQAQHLAGDVSALRREEEAQRAFQLLVAALADVQQLHAAAAANLFAQRTGETFQRTLHAGGNGILERLGGAAQHHHARAVGQAFEGWLEEVAQLDQLLEAGQVAGVEYQGLELRTVLGGPAWQLQLALASAEQLIGELVGERQHGRQQFAVTAQQQRAVHRPHAAGHPAFQAHWRRQAKGTNQAAAGGGVGEGEITIGHERLLRANRKSCHCTRRQAKRN